MEHLNNFASMGMEFQMSQLEMWIGKRMESLCVSSKQGLLVSHHLVFYLAQACDPITTQTPHLALNLEICDMINKNLKT